VEVVVIHTASPALSPLAHGQPGILPDPPGVLPDVDKWTGCGQVGRGGWTPPSECGNVEKGAGVGSRARSIFRGHPRYDPALASFWGGAGGGQGVDERGTKGSRGVGIQFRVFWSGLRSRVGWGEQRVARRGVTGWGSGRCDIDHNWAGMASTKDLTNGKHQGYLTDRKGGKIAKGW